MAKKLTVAEFVTKAKGVHGATYAYYLVAYVNSRTKIEIICGIHGSFWQRPSHHLRGHSCPSCRGLKDTPQFLEDAIKARGNTYGYSLVNYVNAKSKVEIICKVHGSFWQTPDNHLNGDNCPNCRAKTNLQFLEDAIKVHGNTYDYSLANYTHSQTKIEIICKSHGGFWQEPSNHLRGRGCPKCSTYGFNPTKPAILYYLSVKQGEAYKIGITNRSVSERYTNEELQDINIIEEWEFENGQEAYEKEQEILKRYRHLRYKGKDLLKSGNTELFLFDVLGLNTKNLGGFNG